MDEAFERLAAPGQIRLEVVIGIDEQRAPSFKLFQVLEHDHARLALCGPARRHAGQAADLLRYRLPALRLAEVLAIGRQPDYIHRLVAGEFDRVHVPPAFAQTFRVRVIDGAHG